MFISKGNNWFAYLKCGFPMSHLQRVSFGRCDMGPQNPPFLQAQFGILMCMVLASHFEKPCLWQKNLRLGLNGNRERKETKQEPSVKGEGAKRSDVEKARGGAVKVTERKMKGMAQFSETSSEDQAGQYQATSCLINSKLPEEQSHA